MESLGYLTPKEIQVKSMSRILGGQDIIAIGPDGSGKTTTYQYDKNGNRIILEVTLTLVSRTAWDRANITQLYK